MFDLDKWTEIIQVLIKNPLRTALTALGVFWGIFMLVIMLGAGNGLRNGVESGMGHWNKNSLFVWGQRTGKAYQGLPPGRNIRMTNEDFEALKQNLADARVITPRNQLGGFSGNNNVVRKQRTGNFNVMGDYPDVQKVETILIDQGRFINQNDMEDKRKVCVIGTRVKELLFEKDEAAIGEYVRINGVYFRVIGVFSTRASGERALSFTERIYVPFTTFQQAFNYGNTVSWFTMVAKNSASAEELYEQAVAILAARHKVAPDDTRAFGHFNLAKEFGKIQGLFAGINGLSWFVGALTLIAGVIGVSNIMLVLIKERTKEIGIRRALGAKPFNIVSQIVLESLTLTSIAGYLGLFWGVVVLGVVDYLVEHADSSDMMFLNPTVDLNVGIQALIILMVAGALAGLIPARRALKIRPVDALRAE
ncbi:MAG: ABC transporter permease [Bacteroidetes bacterium]|nr:MAG: ABC transporter permease [Bacteroidota bacterium]